MDSKNHTTLSYKGSLDIETSEYNDSKSPYLTISNGGELSDETDTKGQIVTWIIWKLQHVINNAIWDGGSTAQSNYLRNRAKDLNKQLKKLKRF